MSKATELVNKMAERLAKNKQQPATPKTKSIIKKMADFVMQSTITPEMSALMSDQVVAEFQSAYIYLHLSNMLEEISWDGMAKFLHLQAKEELEHGDCIRQFILDKNGHVSMTMLEVPAEIIEQCGCPLTAFTAALEHEKMITARLNTIVGMAKETGDIQTEVFMNNLILEQVEEVAMFQKIVDNLSRATDNASLLLIDKELGCRD